MKFFLAGELLKSDVFLSTTNNIENENIEEYLGIVYVSVGFIGINPKKIVLNQHEEMIKELSKQCKLANGDAIIGLRIDPVNQIV